MPPGVIFSPQTGVISVGNRFGLVPGTYSFRVQLIDVTGNSTQLTVTLTFFGQTPDTQPLPVDLVLFTATSEGGSIRLDWRTASEQNNDRFLVQHSLDGHSFRTIGTVKGNGTTSESIDYSFVDRSPQNGRNYYRLVQVDIDGTTTNSPLVSATISGVREQIKVYPNPTTAYLNIDLPYSISEDIHVVLQDLNGITVLENQVNVLEGRSSLRMHIRHLPSGVYMLSLDGTQIERQVMRIIKID